MDLIRLKELREYHKTNPPVHILVARYLGVGDDSAPKPMTETDIEELMASFPQMPPRS